MKEFIIYISQSSICIAIFYLIYRGFLRSTTFFQFNRIFLLCGLVVSFIIPTIHFSYDVVVPAFETIEILDIQETEIINETANPNIWFVLIIIYCVGIIIQLIRNINSYRKLINITKSGIATKTDRYNLIDSLLVKSPFTIFNHIVINTVDMNEIEKDLILKHEITHISQKHWIDLLCSECAQLLQWFNPLIWLYVSTLKENHEFLADRAVIETGVSPIIYQAALINQRFQGPVFSFSNSFNSPNQLNRLSMIKKEKTSPWRRIAALTLIPSFGLFFWLSATPRYVVGSTESNHINQSTEETQDTALYVNNTDPEKALYIVDNKEISMEDFKKMDPNSLESISVLKNKTAVKHYGKKAENGVIIIHTKNYTSNTNETKRKPTNRPLTFVDGVEIPYEESLKIDPNTIASANALTPESGYKKYGEKGKNGVMSITLKKDK